MQSTWTHNRLVRANALSFDVMVQPLHVVQPYADALAGLVHQVCEAVVHPEQQKDQYHAQLHLPTHLAGFAIPDPGRSAALARLASVLEAGPPLRAAIAAWGVSDAATADEATSSD